MQRFVRLLLSLMFYGLTGMGISLTIVGGIGVSSFNAANVALAAVFQVNVGLVTILVNLAFTLAYASLTRFRYPGRYLVQVLALLCLGRVIDFFTYQVFADLAPGSYLERLGLLVAGTLIGGISTGMVLNLKTITFPVENTCDELSKLTGIAFAKFRYAVDVISVLASVSLSLIYKIPFYAREGTLLSLFLLTAAISSTRWVYQRVEQGKQKSTA
ncbi:MAG: hypothetical protein KF701_03045 [Anaerolineales bacterium]|nr:MAG: hypothetical protein KF701_03045 [Anaerolineales bacterium]